MKLILNLLLMIVLIASSFGCGKETMNGNSISSGPASDPPFTGPDPSEGMDVRKRAEEATSYAITYGALSEGDISILKTYPLVIVHPYNGNITRSQIMRIKEGVNPSDNADNPVVLCYISIGEDSRTFELTASDMLNEARFRGDGSGPSVDPRAVGVKSLVAVNPRGTPTNGGFASYYVNDNAFVCNGAVDKIPDENFFFKTRFVNAGDPLWYATVKHMVMNINTHTPPGLKELLTGSYGKGLACDGVFLDTIDTAAPNQYTSCSDANHTKSEWTGKGFSDFMRNIRADFPAKVILQNRGLFFFDPRQPHYEVSARGVIDIGFFESYYLDNDSATTVSPYFVDNKYNTAYKIMAEANRPDGFKMLSLGYADGFDGPKPGMSIETLTGTSNVGYDILMNDVQESLYVGFRPYLTSALVDLVNPFVKNNAVMTDVTPPVWQSVYNENYQYIAMPPAPRVGIQKIVPGAAGSVTVSWDVAVDMSKVSYVLYYSATPFDFNNMSAATRVVLIPTVGDGYSTIWAASNPDSAIESFFPYQSAISGLQPGTSYDFVIRAIDSLGNEDSNTVKISAVP